MPSLSVPPPGADVDARSTATTPITLFLDRARRARPDLRWTPCRWRRWWRSAGGSTASRWRSSSPPRAAGSWRRSGSPAISDERFRLLTGGARTSLPRQQTLLASVAWSHDLLDDDERRLLRRLTVCAGAFRLGLAETLGSTLGDLDEWAVLDLLGRLVDKSLVQLDDHIDRHGHTETQYRLLETIRQYAPRPGRRRR